MNNSLEIFHPAVAGWFEKTFGKPTEVQQKAWPEIKGRKNTLIAAPTGSGKTLAAFLSIIDDLIKEELQKIPASAGMTNRTTQVVYVSPLKALSNDIEKNLKVPLAGIKEELKERGLPEIEINVAVRTGDTTPYERTQMRKNPPHILVTTPESLYVILTSEGGRKMLSDVHTIIVDEIHAVVGNKRGSHLSLSVERLEHIVKKNLTPQPPLQRRGGEIFSPTGLTRIGLSATQKPIEKIAQFLSGTNGQCTIIDTGHTRQLELSVEVPRSPLTAVMANEVWDEVYQQLEKLIQEHRTTLIFVNTRRLSERVAFNLSKTLGEAAVTSHHGSLSKEHRLDAENRLKSGSLKALVATSSLELGIDIGAVDLVCQIGSPKTIAAFLQRVGRSGHSIGGIPKGILFPLTRDELVECAAIFDAVRRGELDQIVIPEKPLDILAQQIVAETASEEWQEEKLFELVKGSYPYRNITRKEFDEVITMLSEGFTSRRGRRGAYLHYDMVNGKLRGRKGARLTAIVSGGAIPDNFDYDVIKEPENLFIGTLNEDFAIESLAGDIFQLGNTSYRILRVENGKVRVEDAAGLPPNLPFWLGEAPGRSVELSLAVARLREEVSERIGDVSEFVVPSKDSEQGAEAPCTNGAIKDTVNWLVTDVKISEPAAEQLVMYLAAAKAALGVMPTQKTLVLERFFDEAGDMHLVIHSPFGSRLNRAWGLSLRKRFCRKFNFELQAAAGEDAIVLSLGSTHSFPIEEVYDYLKSKTVKDVLTQALLDSPMFEVRWRWNATRALAVLRRRAGEKVPPQLQRMQSEDLIAFVFPDQIACLENIVGERVVPDHPLVKQTIHDCLTEAMDIEELEKLLGLIEEQKIYLAAVDLREPSPLSQEILNARPYAFLDDAPLEERRTRAVINRRWLDPKEAADLGKLDPHAIEAVKSEAKPEAGSADELHDALVLLGIMRADEAKPEWKEYFKQLVEEKRATVLMQGGMPPCPKEEAGFWVAAERLPQLKEIYPDAVLEPEIQIPERLLSKKWERENALVEIIRGRMESSGPVTANELATSLCLNPDDVNASLIKLEGEGFVFRGMFDPNFPLPRRGVGGEVELQWCERRLLARINRYTLEKLRKEIEPVSSQDFMRFLFSWHRMVDKPHGIDSLEEVLNQLEGYEAPAASWEADILGSRVADYEHNWLDMLCLSGKTLWGRFRVRGNGSKSPVKMTPLMLVSRSNLSYWNLTPSPSPREREGENNFSHPAQSVYEYLSKHGSSFFIDIMSGTGLIEAQAEEAVAELTASGVITSDSFTGLRALLVPLKYKVSHSRHFGKSPFRLELAGRWSIIKRNSEHFGEENGTAKNYLDMVARILLKRYGVVFRKLAENENISPPWRELVRHYRMLEARGEIRGGRFVDGVWGEQFALPEAVGMLRSVRKQPKSGNLICISAADPLNLQGVITPGKRVASYPGNRILYSDGVPVAVFESDEVKVLTQIDPEDSGGKWKLQNALVRREIPPAIRPYIGKGIV